MTVPPPDI